MKFLIYTLLIFLGTLTIGPSMHADICIEKLSQLAHGKKVYYAHPLSLYDKPEEKSDVGALEKVGFKVLNPNDKAIENEFQRTQDFGIFLKLVEDSDAVAVKAFPDGKLGAGVVREALQSIQKGKLVFEIIEVKPNVYNYEILSAEKINQRALTRPQTVEYLNRFGVSSRIKYEGRK